jgi:hypothetical protein
MVKESLFCWQKQTVVMKRSRKKKRCIIVGRFFIEGKKELNTVNKESR